MLSVQVDCSRLHCLSLISVSLPPHLSLSCSDFHLRLPVSDSHPHTSTSPQGQLTRWVSSTQENAGIFFHLCQPTQFSSTVETLDLSNRPAPSTTHEAPTTRRRAPLALRNPEKVAQPWSFTPRLPAARPQPPRAPSSLLGLSLTLPAQHSDHHTLGP